jgi:hypothetical protein
MLETLSRHGVGVTAAVWTPSGGQATAVSGYFRDAFNLGLGQVADTSPYLEVASSQVVGIKRNDTVSVKDPFTFVWTDYTVKAIEPDGKGFDHLRLQRA